MSTIQDNHKELEHVIQAKLGDIEHRKRHGTNEERLQAWGEYLVRTGRHNLTEDDHHQFHQAIRRAMKQGIPEERIDLWIQRGKDAYLNTKSIETREELSWVD